MRKRDLCLRLKTKYELSLPTESRFLNAMGSGDDMPAVDQRGSAPDLGLLITTPVLQVNKPRVVVDEVRAGFHTAWLV